MTKKPRAEVQTRLEIGDDFGHLAHDLCHRLEADAFVMLAFDADSGEMRVSFRMGCHIDDDDAELETYIAQNVRQACAMLSKSLRERYVERTMQPGDAPREAEIPEASDDVDGDPPGGRDPGKAH